MLKYNGKLDLTPQGEVRRRWRWNRCLPLVALALAGWVAVMWRIGILWAGR
ncbi:MAG: hypothetical protein K6T65_13045 [Peptococcaceae bacterium]|nr:hypothetical protein [Peptococcaceae bacterium]